MSDPQVEAVSEDRALAQEQLASADPEALASTKADIKTGVVDFFGEKFHVAEKTGALPMLMWSHAADAEEDSNEAAAAIWLMLEDVIHETEFKRFVKTGLKNKAGVDELMTFCGAAMEAITGNPTAPQDGSPTS
jgi:hypothetical protein